MTPQELKNSILQLAVQGKLVEQRPEEGTGEELFRKIQAEKQKLVKAGKIKKEKSLPEITGDEKPFDIPDSWKWVRLVELGAFSSGKTPTMGETKYWNNGTVQWFTSKDLKKKYLDESEMKITELAASGMTRYPAGTLLMVVRSGILKRCLPLCILTQDSTINQDIKAYRLYDSSISEYVYYMIKGLETYILKNYRKQVTTVDSLKFDEFSGEMAFPLPPLAEQKRIVAKIEELLPLIDRYGQAWERLEEFNKCFPGDMQKAILQTAIQGKLVEQRPEEGTGEELAHALRLKKKELIQSGQMPKKAETKPFYTQEELCEYGIPDTWCWVQLSDVAAIQEGAGIRKWQYRDNGTQILCVTNILEGAIDLERKKLFISTEEYLEKYRHLTPQKGDIVSACSGGSWGKTAIFDCSDTMMLNTSTLRLRFFGDLASNDYLYYLTKSSFFKKQLERQLAGMQPNFGYAHYSRIMFPLPPLEEQKRIVAKIEELLPLCEKLR